MGLRINALAGKGRRYFQNSHASQMNRLLKQGVVRARRREVKKMNDLILNQYDEDTIDRGTPARKHTKFWAW